MLRIIVGGLLGAIVLFMWGFVSWTVIGWHETNGFRLPDEPAVRSALTSTIAESSGPGVYWIPAPAELEGATPEAREAAEAAWVESHRQGPVGVLFYQPEGQDPLAVGMLVRGFGFSFVSALLASILLCVSAVRSYAGRVLFVASLGLFAVIIRDMIMWNYMYFPTDYTLVNVADNVVAWLIAGIVIAAIVKRKVAVA